MYSLRFLNVWLCEQIDTIKAAKAAGVKFALGTNNNNVQQLNRLEYSLKIVEECGLTIDDMWFPCL